MLLELSYNSESATMSFDSELVSYIILQKNTAVKFIFQKYKYLYDYTDSSGQTLLHVSAKHGNAEITRYLIQCGSKVNSQDKQGITPLMLAVNHAKDAATVKVLLEANADIYLTDESRKSSALRKVIKIGHTRLEHLSAGLFVGTPYHSILKMFFAEIEKEFAVDKELMAERLRQVHCPLGFVMFMNNAVVTKYLLRNGYPLNEYIRNWSTLHIAVLLRDLENVKLLLSYGADVNDFDNQLQTPLFLYDLNFDYCPKQLKILKMLISHGASLTVCRSDGVTLMEYFFANGKEKTLTALVQADTNELKKLTSKGQTPLHFLVGNNNENIVKVIEMVLKKNIDIDARDFEGKTALHEAVNRGCLNTIKLLSNYGANINLIDIFDNTNLFDILTDRNGYHAKYATVVDLLVHRGNCSFDSTAIEDASTWNGPLQFYQSIKLQKDKNFDSAKLMLRHLVLDEASGESVNEATFMKIESKGELKWYYELCKMQLRDMKTTMVYGTVTLYKLFSESEEKLTLYARNSDFVESFEKFMEDKSTDNFYYFDFLQKRIDDAVETAVARLQAAHVICKLSQLYPEPNNDVYYKITRFLSQQDLNNLLKV